METPLHSPAETIEWKIGVWKGVLRSALGAAYCDKVPHVRVFAMEGRAETRVTTVVGYTAGKLVLVPLTPAIAIEKDGLAGPKRVVACGRVFEHEVCVYVGYVSAKFSRSVDHTKTVGCTRRVVPSFMPPYWATRKTSDSSKLNMAPGVKEVKMSIKLAGKGAEDSTVSLVLTNTCDLPVGAELFMAPAAKQFHSRITAGH